MVSLEGGEKFSSNIIKIILVYERIRTKIISTCIPPLEMDL